MQFSDFLYERDLTIVGSFCARARLLVGLALSLLSACALPRGSVVLGDRPADTLLGRFTQPIPQEWEGRLFRVGDGSVTLGGEAEHSHTMTHVSHGLSAPASVSFNPLGLEANAASGQHVHLIESQSQDPSVTQPAANLPPSEVLRAVIVAHSKLRPVEGQIVAFIGTHIPKGWLLCDGTNNTPAMQGKYVVLSRGAHVPGTMGSDTHSHVADHRHTWGVARSDPADGTNRALHLDTIPPAHPTMTASSLDHLHVAAEQQPAAATTSTERVRPPTVEVLYIQATAMARSMPPGAVIPFVPKHTPLGWAAWSQYESTSIVGRFMAGANTTQAGALYGNESHVHTITATHHVVFSPDAVETAADVVDKGPPVAMAGHTHTADVPESFATAPASHIPMFVSLRFIVKK